MSNRILPILMAIAFILSGCLGGGDDPEPDGDAGSDKDPGSDGGEGGDGSDDGDGPGGEGDGDDAALEAALSANVTTGEAPLHVNLTLNVSGPEGDVSWTLDLGDNTTEEGDTLPATVAHIYEEGGNYTVVLSLSVDDQTAEANLTIRVQSLTQPEPNEVQDGSNSDCLDALGLNKVPGIHSPGAVEVQVDPGTRWEGTASEGRFTVDFYREDNGAWIDNVEEGMVPEDAGFGLVCVRMDTGPAPAQGATWTYQDGLPPEEE